jgi:hypothetical protein
MDSWGTILLGYGVVFGGVIVYAISIVRRARGIGADLGLGHPATEESPDDIV